MASKQAEQTETKPRGRAAQKTFTAIGDFSAEDVPQTEQVTFILDSGRNDDQKQVDRDVAAAHRAWVEAGKPEFTRLTLSQANCPVPRKRYVVDPSATDAILHYLDSAGRLYGVSVVPAPVKRHEDGRAMIFFAVKDKPARKSRKGESAEAQSESTDVQDSEG